MYKIAEVNYRVSKDVSSNELVTSFTPLFKGEFKTLKKQIEESDVENPYPEGFYPIEHYPLCRSIEGAKNVINKHKEEFTKEQLIQSKLGIRIIHDVD